MGRTFDVSFRAIAPERLNSTARYDPELVFDAVQYPRTDVDSWTNVSVRMAPAPNFSAATAHFYSGITFGTPLPTPNPQSKTQTICIPDRRLWRRCGRGVGRGLAPSTGAPYRPAPDLQEPRLQPRLRLAPPGYVAAQVGRAFFQKLV